MRALLLASLLLASCSSSREKPDQPQQPLGEALIVQLEQQRAAPEAFRAFTLDPKAAVRARAALALGRLELRAAVPLLLPLLNDAAAEVRGAAAFGAGQVDLALDPKREDHEATRKVVEEALVTALGQERQAAVRRALVRALGRVSTSSGLDALLGVAEGPDKALGTEALAALGVSGARRAASYRSNPRLSQLVQDGLRGTDEARRTAAAYAAFRQKIPLEDPALRAGLAGGDQTRIFVLRAAAALPPERKDGALSAGLQDRDWRVQVEALRQVGPAQTDAVSTLLADAVQRLRSAPDAPVAHVVREACGALARLEVPPARVTPALTQALDALVPLRGKLRAAACACAVAKDSLLTITDDVDACTAGAPDAWIGKLQVQLVAQRKFSSREKALALQGFLTAEELPVRMAAAAALAEEGSAAAAEVAAGQVVDQTDPGVLSALLELFTGEHAALLPDATLVRLSDRLAGGHGFEELEPLLVVAAVARGRDSDAAREVVRALREHHDAAVREAALGTASGDRDPGPRARPVAPEAGPLPVAADLKTARGTVRLAFDAALAPATVSNFVALARAHFFDGTPFHRVIGDFVAQGGDRRGDGSGGPGYSVPCERTDASFQRGTVGMAHAGLDTGGSQFFLTHSAQPHLDGRYTAFAHVAAGLDVMDALQPDDVLLGVDLIAAPPN